jgi:opacity protein-like surface antigen
MKLKIVLAVCAAITASTAMAQTPAATSGPNAVISGGQNNSDAPVAGRNSFTEGQAKSRIEGAGYTNVSALEKDANGVWRGKGSKGGATSNVSVDFEGNVNPAK